MKIALFGFWKEFSDRSGNFGRNPVLEHLTLYRRTYCRLLAVFLMWVVLVDML